MDRYRESGGDGGDEFLLRLEGIVAGGGTAYINAISSVAKLLKTTSGDERTGVQIVMKALEEPVKQIAINAGLEGAVIVDKVKAAKPVSPVRGSGQISQFLRDGFWSAAPFRRQNLFPHNR